MYKLLDVYLLLEHNTSDVPKLPLSLLITPMIAVSRSGRMAPLSARKVSEVTSQVLLLSELWQELKRLRHFSRVHRSNVRGLGPSVGVFIFVCND